MLWLESPNMAKIELRPKTYFENIKNISCGAFKTWHFFYFIHNFAQFLISSSDNLWTNFIFICEHLPRSMCKIYLFWSVKLEHLGQFQNINLNIREYLSLEKWHFYIIHCYRTSKKHLKDIWGTFQEHLGNIWRTSQEHLRNISSTSQDSSVDTESVSWSCVPY